MVDLTQPITWSTIVITIVMIVGLSAIAIGIINRRCQEKQQKGE